MADKKLPAENKKDKKNKRSLTVKKLPGIFKKSYTEKNFEKKLLKKIYIHADKSKIEKLFQKGGDPLKAELLAVPRDALFTKDEIKEYALLAKEIKGQKGRFALLPFVAAVSAVALIGITVTAFKNVIAKKMIVSACQGIFGAKTDVEKVQVEIFGASIKISNIAIGNKNSVMKNIFEAETITIDFNLTQALRGKFVAENLNCLGMLFDTDRKVSCQLPVKEKKSEKEESAFSKELKLRSQKAIEDLKAQAAELVGGTDPESIVENFKAELKTPDAADDAKNTAEKLIQEWKEKPAELKVQIDALTKSVNSLSSIKMNDIKDYQTVLKDIELAREVLENAQKLQTEGKNLGNKIKNDAKTVEKTALALEQAVKDDKNLIQERIDTIVEAVTNPQELLNTALDTVGYDMLGKYYPYAVQLVDYAVELKKNSDKNPKEESEKKEESRRLEGTTFWYSQEYPAFLIKDIRASGERFDGQITNISSNQDLTGQPVVAKLSISAGKTEHYGTIVVDARKNSNASLVQAHYDGSGFTASIDGSKIAKASGVPSIEGLAAISFDADADGSGFSLSGNVDLNPVRLSSDGFENELATKYYQTALSAVDNLKFGCTAGYKSSTGMIFDLTGNFGQQFSKALKAALGEISADAKEQIRTSLNKFINESNNAAVVKTKEFLGIKEEIDVQNESIDTLKARVEAKITELEKKAATFVGNKTTSALEKAGLPSDVAEKAASKVTDSLSNLLKK